MELVTIIPNKIKNTEKQQKTGRTFGIMEDPIIPKKTLTYRSSGHRNPGGRDENTQIGSVKGLLAQIPEKQIILASGSETGLCTNFQNLNSIYYQLTITLT